MQTVNLQLNVPMGYSIDDFVSKVNAYVASLTKKCQAKKNEIVYEPNEETKEAIKESQAWKKAYDKGEQWAREHVYDSVDDLMTDLMKE